MTGFWDSSGISWTICKQSAPRSRQITTPTPHQSIFTGRILFLMPNQQCQSFVGIGTKLVHECKQLLCTERLKYLQPPTLKYKQQRRYNLNVKNYSGTIWFCSGTKFENGLCPSYKGQNVQVKINAVQFLIQIFFTERQWFTLLSSVTAATLLNSFNKCLD